MPTYTLKFTNNSGRNSNYAFFMQAPKVNPTPAPGEYFSNVWLSKMIPDKGYFNISTQDDFYAWTGNSPTSPAPGTTVEEGMGLLADLCLEGKPGSSYPVEIKNATPYFGVDAHSNNTASTFEITTAPKITLADKYLIGMGLVNNTGQIAPVATLIAQANMGYTFLPIVKFYIAQSYHQVGTAVDINGGSLKGKLAEIDFSSGDGLGKDTATISVDETNEYKVTYQ